MTEDDTVSPRTLNMFGSVKIKNKLKNMWRELNDFFSSTSIHGLPYIHHDQAGSTRFIWTLFVGVAVTTATEFLVQTIGDWDTKPISTTIETESAKGFEFPAISFHPGEFSSKKAFLRTFLNQFHMTRYNESSPLYVNEEFMNNFKMFVNNFEQGKSLFERVKEYLLEEEEFIKAKSGIFRQEVCSFLAFVVTGESTLGKVKSRIEWLYNKNMFKVHEFNHALSLAKRVLSSEITERMSKGNVTGSEINSLCNDKENNNTKRKLEALILSYLYIFMSPNSVESGPGDLAAEDYFQVSPPLVEMLTNMFSQLAGTSQPINFLDTPKWFIKAELDIYDIYTNILSTVVPDLAKKRYLVFWKVFNVINTEQPLNHINNNLE